MEAFWAKVSRRGDHECWPWMGCIHKSGYGHFKQKGECFKAHRVAYALTFGTISWKTGMRGPRGVIVMHQCDNRRCCNPAHLIMGTQRDNMVDCSRKQRIGHGASHGHVKLTDDDVAVIKAMQAQGIIGRPGRGWNRSTRDGATLSLAAVGRRFGVSGKTIEQVVRRRAWVGVGEPEKATV